MGRPRWCSNNVRTSPSSKISAVITEWPKSHCLVPTICLMPKTWDPCGTASKTLVVNFKSNILHWNLNLELRFIQKYMMPSEKLAPPPRAEDCTEQWKSKS